MLIEKQPTKDNSLPRSKMDAKSFLKSLQANVNNVQLSDSEFREYVKNSLPIVEFWLEQEFNKLIDTSG